MPLWNSFYLILKEFRYFFLCVFIIFTFNIILEYYNFLNFKSQKHYSIDNALLINQYTKNNKNNKNTGF